MARLPWTFHAACLRDGTTQFPAGTHEVLLIMRDAFDLVGPAPGQVIRLVPGAVLHAEIAAAADETLALHLEGARASSGFRFGLGLMLGLDEMSDQIEVLIDEWIDAHVAVALLPLVIAPGELLPARRYEGVLNAFTAIGRA
jgi:hypothetical protein